MGNILTLKDLNKIYQRGAGGDKDVCESTQHEFDSGTVYRIGEKRADHFIICSQDQLYNLLKAYIEHYNTKKPHQGIEQRVPKGYTIRNFGRIKSKPILFGLNYEYYREAA
jgi:hypothetical protein